MLKEIESRHDFLLMFYLICQEKFFKKKYFFGDAAATSGRTAPRLRVYILKNIFLDNQLYKNIFLKFFFSKKPFEISYFG
jgi:hypothetical protein